MLLLLILLLRVGGSLLPAGEGDAFTHKRHAPLKLKCAYCHVNVEKRERAGFPALSKCRTCHVAMAERKIPAQRIYQVKDFVVFSHATHLAANTACADCHGDVYSKDALTVARPTTMIACVDCHKERHATQLCNACHELGQ